MIAATTDKLWFVKIKCQCNRVNLILKIAADSAKMLASIYITEKSGHL